MENGNKRAFPADEHTHTDGGLTKREYLAGQIAIGLSVQAIAGNHNSLNQMEISVPMYAVRIADALLAELEKTKQQEQ
jgi:hypothetical protein